MCRFLPNQMFRVKYFSYVIYLFIYLFIIVKTINGSFWVRCKLLFWELYLGRMCRFWMNFCWLQKSILFVLSFWCLHPCHGSFLILFLSEIPFTEISCLIETSQLILVCDFPFALLDFLLGGFSEQIIIDLFAEWRFQKFLR